MNIEVLKAAIFDANCYVLWAGDGPGALIVDPGPGTAEQIESLLADRGLEVGAVLLTHGHVDHVWDAKQVSGDAVPVYIPEADAYWLSDPLGGLQMRAEALGLGAWEAPAQVERLTSQTFSPVAGLTLRLVPAPGHSPGSSLFLIAVGADQQPLALSGDVIFAGSVGRTDLPGGDEWVMRETLRTLSDVLDPATVLLPGHGEPTRWKEELETNPYVARAKRRETR